MVLLAMVDLCAVHASDLAATSKLPNLNMIGDSGSILRRCNRVWFWGVSPIVSIVSMDRASFNTFPDDTRHLRAAFAMIFSFDRLGLRGTNTLTLATLSCAVTSLPIDEILGGASDADVDADEDE